MSFLCVVFLFFFFYFLVFLGWTVGSMVCSLEYWFFLLEYVCCIRVVGLWPTLVSVATWRVGLCLCAFGLVWFRFVPFPPWLWFQSFVVFFVACVWREEVRCP